MDTDEQMLAAYWQARADADRVVRQRYAGTILCSAATAQTLEGLCGEELHAAKIALVAQGLAEWMVE